MTRHVGNFRLEIEIGGRDEELQTEPDASLDGFHLTIYQRDYGNTELSYVIHGDAYENGILEVTVVEGEAQVQNRHSYIQTLSQTDYQTLTVED